MESRESTLMVLTENLPPTGQASIGGSAPNEPEHESTSSPGESSSSSIEITRDTMEETKKASITALQQQHLKLQDELNLKEATIKMLEEIQQLNMHITPMLFAASQGTTSALQPPSMVLKFVKHSVEYWGKNIQEL